MNRIAWMFGLAALAVVAVALVTGCSPILAMTPAGKPAGGAAVRIDNFSFGPTDMDVPAGTTVTWTNQDDVPHIVASDDQLFKSKPLDTDDHFSFTFTKPGTYMYYCTIHPRMTAKIVVQ